ncbi:hypothetical protein [Pedobacter gandavensis]|uniref:DUF4238 domain-containing protein n=1 Tax=Pedobacter gandavensis TaxID=2679963 RepID=A0ABR6EU54_9SPHI|nr:hypothetical protein [Pedobacter gandavensis]MBB2148800.1 hypothetical protein [Pedobacter gandavensis]
MKKAHHYSYWIRTIKFLRSRGWKITENPSYKQHYAILSQYHKLGSKGDVRCLMEITGRGVEVKFGNVVNLWTGHAQSFWDQTDSRHAKLTYLQYKSVELEKRRVIEFFMSLGGKLEGNEWDIPPVERILNTLRINKHFHGEINCLDDIKVDMDNRPERFYSYNNKDRNGKMVKCGEIKYFYPYPHYRLSSGEVWHTSNSSWCVLHGNGISYVQSSDLFDFNPTLRRRQKKEVNLLQVLNLHVKHGDFLQAHKIQLLIKRREAQPCQNQ